MKCVIMEHVATPKVSTLTEKSFCVTFHVQDPRMDTVNEELVEEVEEEEEPSASNSVPSSPKLSVRSPLSHTLSHSFDDLVSSVNNEVVTSPTSRVSPQSPFRQLAPKPVHFHPLESGESGSDSEIEMSEFSSLRKKRANISATNPLSDHGLGENLDLDHTETDTDKSGDDHNKKTSIGSGPGKFAQLKGKFLQRVSNLRPPKSSLRSRPSSRPHPTKQNGDSDSSVSQSQSQPSSKFMSVKRGHFNSSPDSLRKWKNRSPQNEPSEEELRRQEAREQSKTTFLILRAV